jgi:ADP-ribosylation factor-like protein 1
VLFAICPEVGKLKAQVWDLGGQESIRPYWRSYYSEQESVVFVVDSCDVDRMPIAKRELMNIVEEEELKSACVCVFANKQDMPEALSTADIAAQLGLDAITDKKWTIIATSALRGEGLKEGFTWIADQLDEKRT